MKKITALLAGILCCLAGFTRQKTVPQKPNVIIVFMDDMGYGDLEDYGATGYKTPNLTELAKNGMRFTSFYTPQAVCTASRAALMTGTYPNRINMFGAYNPNSGRGDN